MDWVPVHSTEETYARVCARDNRASLPKWLHLESGNEAHPSGKKSAGSTVSISATESRRKGGHGGQHS